MRPIGSQAGTQAVMDARVLAKELATAKSIPDGLLSYDNIRRPPMNKVMLMNREYGPEIVMQMAEDKAPQGFSDINQIIPHSQLEEIALSFKKAAGFDPAELNARPSLSVSR
jgi:2-polyprenyl-6-methoxyphenol hydroxylase-like FAD-dependent oxidoreductase